jgi:hypothetical protein
VATILLLGFHCVQYTWHGIQASVAFTAERGVLRLSLSSACTSFDIKVLLKKRAIIEGVVSRCSLPSTHSKVHQCRSIPFQSFGMTKRFTA